MSQLSIWLFAGTITSIVLFGVSLGYIFKIVKNAINSNSKRNWIIIEITCLCLLASNTLSLFFTLFEATIIILLIASVIIMICAIFAILVISCSYKASRDLKKNMEKQKRFLDEIVKTSQFRSEFMSTMSHELRTPLNAIIGFSELMLEGLYGELEQKHVEFLNEIHESAEYLLEMVKRVMDISKIDSGNLKLNIQKVSLNKIVTQVQDSLKMMYTKKGLDFKLENLNREVILDADSIRLKEILYNLINNAIKFTMEGSVTVKYHDNKEFHEITIIDTGTGIPEHDQPKIFREFERIESPFLKTAPGVGLGLPLTKRLVNLHGGEIFFTSELGKGSQFTFTIPKSTE